MLKVEEGNKKRLVIGCVVVLLCVHSSVKASTVQSNDSDGLISFSGSFETIGTPDPPP